MSGLRPCLGLAIRNLNVHKIGQNQRAPSMVLCVHVAHHTHKGQRLGFVFPCRYIPYRRTRKNSLHMHRRLLLPELLEINLAVLLLP